MPAEQHYGFASKADLRSFVTIQAVGRTATAKSRDQKYDLPSHLY
jgi:hypothetical protein